MISRGRTWGYQKPPPGWPVDPSSPLALPGARAWLFDEGGGLLAHDATGNSAGPAALTSASFVDADGYAGAGGGYGAAGPAALCTGGGHADLALPAVGSADDYALVIHHRPTTWPGGFTCLLDDASRVWSLFFGTGGAVSFNGTMTGYIAVANAMAAGQWWQSIFTRVAGTAYWFINGALATMVAGNTTSAAATTVSFGSNPSGGGSSYNGLYGSVLFVVGRGVLPGEAWRLAEEPYLWFAPPRRPAWAAVPSTPAAAVSRIVSAGQAVMRAAVI